MIHRLPAILGLALVASIPAAAAAPGPAAQGWTVEHAGSTLGFAGVGDGSAFEGSFGRWEADIAFDPADLAHSAVEVRIDMTSGNTGDANRDTPLLETNWFAPALFPTATFKADTITASDSGYVAQGTLTIRDVTEPVSLPFTVAIEGDTATMQGSVTIDRQKFKVGAGTWQDRSVANEVQVKVNITASKAG